MNLSRENPAGSTLASRDVGSSYLDERPRINLDFVDICYPVLNSSKIGGKKQILQGVSGSFKFGELTAILGSSGAGKSTLLNILTGYMLFCLKTEVFLVYWNTVQNAFHFQFNEPIITNLSVGVGGSIRINGYPCRMNVFRKLSTYIMQDDLIQPQLTVEESMIIAANLKLGRDFSREAKLEVTSRILETLGLEKQRSTRTENLSGGQRKRVSIALELINNPPVIFLDEPTTGLDVVSTAQVIELLQKLAREGRTVVCTLHQPSAFICNYFDHMYVMTRGCCVYQGSYQKLVPFLSHIGHECPTTYNPADYIIEIISVSSKDDINRISQVVQNGKLSIESGESQSHNTEFEKVLRQQKLSSSLNFVNTNLQHPVRFWQQFVILLKRRFKQQFRNLLTLTILLLHHILVGLLLGSIFRGVGTDASRPFENFKFLISVVVFFMYTNVMGPVLLFPLEMKVMKREYFNRWYGMKAYFAALSVATLPSHIFFGCLFVLISYTISSQPLETSRLAFFIVIGLLLGYTSEGWGLTVGSVFDSRNGSIVGPASIVPLLALSVYGMGYGTTVEPLMQFLMSGSYLRYGVVGLTVSVYDRNRTLDCDTDRYVYCHYKDPVVLLKDLGMEGNSIYQQITGLMAFLLIHRLTAYLGIRFTVNVELSSRLMNFAGKLFRLRQKHNR